MSVITFDSWKTTKAFLRDRIDSSPGSRASLIERAGLSRDAYYKLFKYGRLDRSMRKGTIDKLCAALNLNVHYVGGYPAFSVKTISDSECNCSIGRSYVICNL